MNLAKRPRAVRRAVPLGILLGVAVVLAACAPAGPGGFGPQASLAARDFATNGEQIYFTSTSQRGTPITFTMAGGGMMGNMMMGRGTMACATCHGPNGRGGQVQMMMASFTAPDIRYQSLTSGEMAHGDEDHGEGEEHPPYTDETIKRAITQGVNPAGEPLDWPMPRWSLSDEDLEDLVTFLKTLD